MVSSTPKVGEVVRLKRGKLAGTPECPVTGDVTGVKARVVRDARPSLGPDGKVRERIVVRPLVPLEADSFPIPLEVPVADVQRSVGRRVFGGLGEGYDRIFGKKRRACEAT